MLAPTLRTCLLGGTLLLASACNVPPPTIVSTSPTSASPSPAATANSGSRVAIADLPIVEPDPGLLTAICDPEPIQLDPEAGDTSVFCQDAVVLGFRAASGTTPGPITRIYVRRPTCAATPCSTDELSTATVIAWGAAAVVAIRIDSRLDSVPPPQRLFDDPWPRPNIVPAPEVQREILDSAPEEVATRTTFPYCGRATYDTPQEVLACFRDSVLLSRRAEVIQVSFGTEGGEVLDIVRFNGTGALTRYQEADGRWTVQRGSLILGAPGGSWTFNPWDEGDAVE